MKKHSTLYIFFLTRGYYVHFDMSCLYKRYEIYETSHLPLWRYYSSDFAYRKMAPQYTYIV